MNRMSFEAHLCIFFNMDSDGSSAQESVSIQQEAKGSENVDQYGAASWPKTNSMRNKLITSNEESKGLNPSKVSSLSHLWFEKNSRNLSVDSPRGISTNLSSNPKKKDKRLHVHFMPTQNTVIIGKGKECRENDGNIKLFEIAKKFLPQYSAADSKHVKSEIVSKVISTVYNTPGGIFVKHGKDGFWYEANKISTREKVGYVFRDLLADRYRSSSKSKGEMRQLADKARVARFQGLLEQPKTKPIQEKAISSSNIKLASSSSEDTEQKIGPFHPVDEKEIDLNDPRLQDL